MRERYTVKREKQTQREREVDRGSVRERHTVKREKQTQRERLTEVA